MVDLTVVPLTFSKWRFYRENNPFINGGFSSKPIRNGDLMGFNGDSMGYDGIPSGKHSQFAIENGHRNS